MRRVGAGLPTNQLQHHTQIKFFLFFTFCFLPHAIRPNNSPSSDFPTRRLFNPHPSLFSLSSLAIAPSFPPRRRLRIDVQDISYSHGYSCLRGLHSSLLGGSSMIPSATGSSRSGLIQQSHSILLRAWNPCRARFERSKTSYSMHWRRQPSRSRVFVVVVVVSHMAVVHRKSRSLQICMLWMLQASKLFERINRL